MKERPMNTKVLRGGVAVAGLGWLLASAAWAHHSQSEFDFKSKVDVEGTITRLEWKSPHARLYVDSKNEQGAIVNWNFELPSPNTLMRRGWTRESLKPGDKVTVNGARARNFPDIAYAISIKDKDGKALFTGTTQVFDPQ
jgi:uncharacterized protein DUF6152